MITVFAERLKELRLERGVGQVELARSLGVSKGVISLWENAKREPPLSSLVAVAGYFEVSLDFLCGLSD